MSITTMEGFAVKDVSRALGISEDTCYRRIKDNTLDAVRIGDRLFIKSQALVDAVERGLGSKVPDQIDARIAAAEKRERDELNRGNGPVRVNNGVTDEGVRLYTEHTYPEYDSRSKIQQVNAPRRAAELAKHNAGADTAPGDEGRRTVIRRLTPRPLLPDGKPVPAGVRIAPYEDPQGTFAEQLADAVEVLPV